jgi:hypothetical protein
MYGVGAMSSMSIDDEISSSSLPGESGQLASTARVTGLPLEEYLQKVRAATKRYPVSKFTQLILLPDSLLIQPITASPSGPSRYPLLNVDHLFASDWVFQDDAWPSKLLCDKTRPRLPLRSQIPRLFVTPHDKGYNVTELLYGRLALIKSQQHPLPWFVV